MGTFSIDISKFVNKTEKQANQIVRKIALETYNRVKEKNPVDTGQLRRSWTVSTGTFPATFDGNYNAITTALLTDTINIATDKSYAPMLEYGLYPKPGGGKTINGFSTQAPKGMVRITVKEIAAWANTQRW
ncbi:HK97 gp10 family phage protein [Gallibacterium genomosp. 3]|uniref:Bacteriophage protein n=1 Tax=Gallibacterium genomosp. 3 TaxID=505345 RepID=A0A1A7PYF0_9PAST|nr:HK97 gp10 family phage protein [Gallibacterium genomosp. 3]OBX06185.1 bacteriophage protein [Gallibacterium genomosp. 3]